MRTQDRILEVIRKHPEGITTSELSQIFYPEKTSFAQVYQKARKLELYGLVTHFIEYHQVECGKRLKVSVWKPCEVES